MDDMLSQIRELIVANIRDVSWSRQVQDSCEAIWTTLDHDPQAQQLPTLGALDCFIQLLSEIEAFELAKHVIPQLRLDAPKDLRNKGQIYIVQNTRHMRNRTITTDVEPFFMNEKAILEQAEMYRARVAFETKHQMNAEERVAFERWWHSCPLNAKPEATCEQAGSDVIRESSQPF